MIKYYRHIEGIQKLIRMPAKPSTPRTKPAPVSVVVIIIISNHSDSYFIIPVIRNAAVQ